MWAKVLKSALSVKLDFLKQPKFGELCAKVSDNPFTRSIKSIEKSRSEG